MSTTVPYPQFTDRQKVLAEYLRRCPRATLRHISRRTGMTQDEVIHETALLAIRLGVLGAGRAALIEALREVA